MGDLVQREHPKIRVNRGGVRGTKTCNISETAQEVAYALSIGTKINDLG